MQLLIPIPEDYRSNPQSHSFDTLRMRLIEPPQPTQREPHQERDRERLHANKRNPASQRPDVRTRKDIDDVVHKRKICCTPKSSVNRQMQKRQRRHAWRYQCFNNSAPNQPQQRYQELGSPMPCRLAHDKACSIAHYVVCNEELQIERRAI
jgi:hypothetical protein